MWLTHLADELDELKKRVKRSFSAVKEEMDDHLYSINRNTDEIHEVYEYLSELDSKLEKLSERMDQFEMQTRPNTVPQGIDEPLTRREQEVFMAIYTAEKRVNVADIARQLGYTEKMVTNYLYDLVSKGVPIVKECSKGEMQLSLNAQFKDVQAKQNVLQIEESVAKELN
jgi:predicted transcriptional regulator